MDKLADSEVGYAVYNLSFCTIKIFCCSVLDICYIFCKSNTEYNG